MQCSHFDNCGSCTFDIDYKEQLNLKKEQIGLMFAPFYSGDIDIVASDETGYRSRAEFGFWHQDDELFYTMNSVDKGRKVFIKECPKVDIKIANLMPILLGEIKKSPYLKKKIFGVEFIATKIEIMAVLLYHSDISNIFSHLYNLAKKLKIKLVARSRGKREFFDGTHYVNANANADSNEHNVENNFQLDQVKDPKLYDASIQLLREELDICGQKYYMRFGESAFIQPNTKVNEKMITWVINHIKNNNTKDLLELYCGHGNFTIPLSFYFKSVLATEISKSSIASANINCKLNNANNIKFVRMDSDELISALSYEREFRRLSGINLKNYNFSHVLVDPPRAGLSKSVIEFIKNYNKIIYISCNPLTLLRDLELIASTHEIEHFAIFDQFAHTHHLECGILLNKKETV